MIGQDNQGSVERALASCAWADEIVFVDGGSSDATAEIARASGARVYVRPFDYTAHQKNYCLARATGEWTFLLDTDEVISPELAAEVRAIASRPIPDYSLYHAPRKLIDHRRWLPCCGTYPDWQLRFFRTGHYALELRRAHAGGVFAEPVGKLRHPILHYSFHDLDSHMRRITDRTTLSALDYYERGCRPRGPFLFLKFFFTFWHEYCTRGGVRCGVPGLMYAAVRAVESFSKYAKVWELANDTSALDLSWELAHKQAADLALLADELQPQLLREWARQNLPTPPVVAPDSVAVPVEVGSLSGSE